MIKSLAHKYRLSWLKRRFLTNIAFGFCLLIISLFITYYANLYTVIHASNWTTDIILDNLPVVNVDFFFNEGTGIFILIVLGILLYDPHRIPFVLKSVALFFVVRSLFMMLTHIAPPPHMSYVDPSDFISKISSGDDLFFSAHTGLPFLFALIFWDDKYLKYLFIFFSIAGAAIVLLGHLHYSIDVFSAFFITFGVFYITRRLFPKDAAMFTNGIFE